MDSSEDRISRITLALLPLSVITIACAASLLPQDLLIGTGKILAAWLALSVPIGVFVGHCLPHETERA